MAQKTLSVSELNRYMARLIKSDPVIGNISVMGEVSNINYHSSGHLYLSLKDSSSVIGCIMYRNDVPSLRYRLENGMKVTVWGYVSVFERGGKYSLVIKALQLSGEGALSAAFKALYLKLKSEGLFDNDHKKQLPFFPKKVCVITSETGAAVRDILKIIKTRNSFVDVMVYPALVQGENAAADLAAALEDVNKNFRDVDVIIIGRGGGSKEDLWAFNEEVLARAVYDSNIPVISAVGHETDVSISDLVADVKAETPSMAASVAVPDIDDIRSLMDQYEGTLRGGLRRLFEMENAAVNRYDHVFFDRHIRAAVERRSVLLERYSPQSFASMISSMIDNRRLRVTSLYEKIRTVFGKWLEMKSAAVESCGKILDVGDPEAIVTRGYAIVREHGTDRVITSVADVSADKKIDIKLKDGIIESEITGITATGGNL